MTLVIYICIFILLLCDMSSSVLRTVADYVRWTPPHFLNIPPPDSRLPPLARRNHIYQRITLVKLHQRRHHILLPLHPMYPKGRPISEPPVGSDYLSFFSSVQLNNTADNLGHVKLGQIHQIFCNISCLFQIRTLVMNQNLLRIRFPKLKIFTLTNASRLKILLSE